MNLKGLAQKTIFEAGFKRSCPEIILPKLLFNRNRNMAFRCHVISNLVTQPKTTIFNCHQIPQSQTPAIYGSSYSEYDRSDFAHSRAC